jgi:hypothetical protein
MVSWQSETKETGHMRICRDEDCPNCGWPETYVEGETSPERMGCNKCGWSIPVESAKP